MIKFLIKIYKDGVHCSAGILLLFAIVGVFGGYMIGFFHAFGIISNAINDGTISCF